MNDLKEEIKSRLSVEDVVGQYIELKRAGRNLKGRSPWGVDKTPSFMVSPEKGIWHDFPLIRAAIFLPSLWRLRVSVSKKLWKNLLLEPVSNLPNTVVATLL